MGKLFLISLSVGFLALNGCDMIYKWQTEYPDNYIEERLEDVIESKTGKKIDLTPVTGEEKQDTEIFKFNY